MTDPNVTRYFMTTEEAVRLVMQAAVSGAPGEVLVLDMGEPVRIDDVARRLIARSGRNIAIQYTGLRKGEKLHERLVGSEEIATARDHPLVLHTTVPALDVAALSRIDGTNVREIALWQTNTSTAEIPA